MSVFLRLRVIKDVSSVFILILLSTLYGCSGYQSVSYYADGIYGDVAIQHPQQLINTDKNNDNKNGSYYKNYFATKSTKGIQENYVFTDIEQYQDPSPSQANNYDYQAYGSWGDQVSRININVINNQPFGWNWLYAPFNFGRSSFWGYNYHPWYFNFNQYPFNNNFGWGFNPYGWSRWNRYNTTRLFSNPVIYSSLNGGRGQSGYSNSNRKINNISSGQYDISRGSLRNNMARKRNQDSGSDATGENNTYSNRSSRIQSSNNYIRSSNNNRNYQNNSNSRSSSRPSYRSAPAGSRNSSSRSSTNNSSRRR